MRFIAISLWFAFCFAVPIPKEDDEQTTTLEAPPALQPRTVYHIDFTQAHNENKTDTALEMIPKDQLCEFCYAVVEKMKTMQKEDPHFEEKMSENCLKHSNSTQKEACKSVNKVNLKMLANEKATEICSKAKLCTQKEVDSKLKNPPDIRHRDV